MSGKWWTRSGVIIKFTFIHLADAFIQSDSVHSGYTCIVSMCFLGIEPMTFCAANAMLYHWATGACCGSASLSYSDRDQCLCFSEPWGRGGRWAGRSLPSVLLLRQHTREWLTPAHNASRWTLKLKSCGVFQRTDGSLSLSLSINECIDFRCSECKAKHAAVITIS